MRKHCPGPWIWKNVAGAGLEIFAPVHLDKAVTMPDGMPQREIMIYGLVPKSPRLMISYERWVQFSPPGWDEMQEANARLMAFAECLRALLTPIPVWGGRTERHSP